jgi:hypothetical protein
MNSIDIEQLVNYHIKGFIVEPGFFQQVYEEIITFAYWLKGFSPHNITSVRLRQETV